MGIIFWLSLFFQKKYDNARKTGTGGGVDAKLTPVDEKVLEITGKDSPAVVSLGVAETFESTVPVPAVSQCVQKPSKRKFILN